MAISGVKTSRITRGNDDTKVSNDVPNFLSAMKEKYSSGRASAVDARLSNKRRSVVGGFPLL